MAQSPNNLLHRIIGPRLVTPPVSPICGWCHSDAVAVLECDERSDGHRRVVLRCGECQTWHDLTLSPTATDRLYATLESGLAAIERDLEAVDRERMGAQIEAFVEALARDLVDAQDFG